MKAQRFDVFGRRYEIRRETDGWRALAVGSDGKLGPAGFEIPPFVADAELEQYLFDLFHELATPGSGGVRRVDR